MKLGTPKGAREERGLRIAVFRLSIKAKKQVTAGEEHQWGPTRKLKNGLG